MNALVEQLRYSHGNKHLAGKMLSRTVTVASSIGAAAEVGKKFSIAEKSLDTFIGAVQVGEYIQTGKIPAKALIISVIDITPAETLH